MHTDETNAIRYLMNEMDPSEEMEFEKLMREDEDLLIEVESLRATQRKLSDLPLKTPPEKLTKHISNEVTQLQSDRVHKSKNITYFIKSGIAAAILLAVFTGGGYYFYNGSSESSLPVNPKKEGVEPWVDRNEVLRFSDIQPTSQSSPIQNEVDKSLEKLQLVNDFTTYKPSGSGIMLTGSPE